MSTKTKRYDKGPYRPKFDNSSSLHSISKELCNVQQAEKTSLKRRRLSKAIRAKQIATNNLRLAILRGEVSPKDTT